MGANARVRWLVIAASCLAALAGCGQSSDPLPPDRSQIPVLAYSRIDRDAFKRDVERLRDAGYETVELDTFARFVAGERVDLPARPLLLTVDGARRDTWAASDAVLRANHLGAVLFVDVGLVEEEAPGYLTWDELGDLQRSGRWDVQLQSGTGGRQQIRYGSGPDDNGPFYAYRGADEVLGGWRERVFSDITYGEEQLAFHVPDYRPLAFAPPYGNYGQAGTNDRRIPTELLERALLSFDIVFVQDRPGFARPGASNPLGRFEVTDEGDLDPLFAP